MEGDRVVFVDGWRDASAALPPGCQESFARLAKLIRARLGKFQLLILDCRDERLRDRLIKDLDESLHGSGGRATQLRLSDGNYPDFAVVERTLRVLAETNNIIHVTGGPSWFDAARWEEFNIRRESVAHEVRASLFLWLDPDCIADLARIAIDLWTWRSAVITFTTTPQRLAATEPDIREIDDRTRLERAARIEFLRQVLMESDTPDEIRTGFALELGDLAATIGQIADAETSYRTAMLGAANDHSRAVAAGRLADILRVRGELDEALRIHREDQLPIYDRLDDVRDRVVTMGKIADILRDRGQLDEALRIHQEDELPVYDRLGDVRARAMTMGKIADLFKDRGQLDEALRIHLNEELPVYDRLGDMRSRAATMGGIADILQARGQFDEALRIRHEEQLPVYDRLGAVRSRAVTMGKIADVLQARGQFDEALRIRRAEELPVYDRLGDVRSRAITLGKIADVLKARGELDEALRIHREEELPVFNYLGDVSGRALTMSKIADVLQGQGQLDEALRIRREEQLPVYDRLGDVRSRAVTMGQIADILQTRGELGEALRIRREEELPVYDHLGGARERAITMGKIADILQARGQFDEALRLRREEELPVYARLGDVRSRSVALYKVADALIQAGGLVDARAKEIYDASSEAFTIARQLNIPDGIGYAGAQLAEVLGKSGRSNETFPVLDEAETAFSKLNDLSGLKHVKVIRHFLTATKQ